MDGTVSSTFVCTRCQEEQPLSEFSPNTRRRRGHQSWCKTCYREYRRRKYATDPEEQRISRLQNEAHRTASRLLRERHMDEFDRYYKAALRERGLT